MELERSRPGIEFHALDKRQGAEALQCFCCALSCLRLQLVHVDVWRHTGKIADPCLDAFLQVLQKHIAAVLHGLTEFDDHPERLAIRLDCAVGCGRIRWIGLGRCWLAASGQRNEQAAHLNEGVPLARYQVFEFMHLDCLLQIVRLSGKTTFSAV